MNNDPSPDHRRRSRHRGRRTRGRTAQLLAIGVVTALAVAFIVTRGGDDKHELTVVVVVFDPDVNGPINDCRMLRDVGVTSGSQVSVHNSSDDLVGRGRLRHFASLEDFRDTLAEARPDGTADGRLRVVMNAVNDPEESTLVRSICPLQATVSVPGDDFLAITVGDNDPQTGSAAEFAADNWLAVYTIA